MGRLSGAPSCVEGRARLPGDDKLSMCMMFCACPARADDTRWMNATLHLRGCVMVGTDVEELT